MIVEIIGYIGTILVVTSFLFKDKLLRVINSFACMTFILYGYLKGCDVPVMASNIIILLINIKYFISWKKKES
jgi:hypothetical protein